MSSLPKTSPPAILIVDDDLGFLVWLGLTLGANGFVTVPATSGAQAKQVIEELRVTINLAIVNLALAGMSDLSDSLKQSDPSMKVIAIQNSRPRPSLTTRTDASHSRTRSGWITLVRKILGVEKATGALEG